MLLVLTGKCQPRLCPKHNKTVRYCWPITKAFYGNMISDNPGWLQICYANNKEDLTSDSWWPKWLACTTTSAFIAGDQTRASCSLDKRLLYQLSCIPSTTPTSLFCLYSLKEIPVCHSGGTGSSPITAPCALARFHCIFLWMHFLPLSPPHVIYFLESWPEILSRILSFCMLPQ